MPNIEDAEDHMIDGMRRRTVRRRPFPGIFLMKNWPSANDWPDWPTFQESTHDKWLQLQQDRAEKLTPEEADAIFRAELST